jgi:hypothetical protein
MIEHLVKIKKKHSAFLYAVMESQEGLAAYSTIDFVKGGGPDSYCTIQFWVAAPLESDLKTLLLSLKEELELIIDF